jgi:hypothetical protein
MFIRDVSEGAVLAFLRVACAYAGKLWKVAARSLAQP